MDATAPLGERFPEQLIQQKPQLEKLAQRQAEVNARNAERVAIQQQQAAAPVGAPAAPAPAAAAPVAAAAKAGTVAKSTTTKVTQPIVAAAPAAAPVQTTTKSSKK